MEKNDDMKGEVVKSQLKWLCFNFPFQKDAESRPDKICNAIYAYCNNALEYIKELEEKVK